MAKCVAAIRRLASAARELRRPIADFLAQGTHELRVRQRRVNYRILCFFPERNVAVLLHALSKEARIPPADLARALVRKEEYHADPSRFSYFKEIE